MAGGYVKWNDGPDMRTVINHRPRGSRNSYTFPKDQWIRIEDETDWKFYEWKEKVDPCWRSKRRLSKSDGESFQDKMLARPTVDRNDPNFKASVRAKEAGEKIKEADEIVRKYFGQNLPEYLKKQKKVTGGDQ